MTPIEKCQQIYDIYVKEKNIYGFTALFVKVQNLSMYKFIPRVQSLFYGIFNLSYKYT